MTARRVPLTIHTPDGDLYAPLPGVCGTPARGDQLKLNGGYRGRVDRVEWAYNDLQEEWSVELWVTDLERVESAR